jgi:hypothetical protein
MFRSLALGLILMSVVLPSCIAVGGTQNDRRPTAGQELTDLKVALDKGAITPAEYERKKAEILAEH